MSLLEPHRGRQVASPVAENINQIPGEINVNLRGKYD